MKTRTIQISDEFWLNFYGVETMEEVRAIQEEEAKLWCQCEEDTDGYYVPDGVDDECHKHHWRCCECKKIKQIG